MNKWLKMVEKKEIKFALILFLVLTMIFFHTLILNPDEMMYSEASDVVFYHYKMQKMKFDAVRENTILLWNPIYTMGISYVGDPESFMFYPLYIPFYFFEPDFLFGLFSMIHVFLAGLFMYLFTRAIKLKHYPAIISSILFMFSPKLMAHLFAGHYVFTAICYTPLLLYLTEKYIQKKKTKYLAFFALALALQLLSLHPQIVLYSSSLVGVYALFRLLKKEKSSRKIGKQILFFSLAVFLALLISAAYILPIRDGVIQSDRAAPDFAFVSEFSMPPTHLITLFVPNLFGTPLSHTYWGAENFWELTIFVGVIALLLSLTALLYHRNLFTYFFSFTALISVIFALGSNTPLFRLFLYLPGFALFRAPSRILILFVLAVAIVSGFGVQSLMENQKARKKLGIITLILSAILLSSVLVIHSQNQEIISLGQDMVQTRLASGLLPTEGPFAKSIEYYLSNVPLVFNQIMRDLIILTISIIALSITLLYSIKNNTFNQKAKIALIIIIFIEIGAFSLPLIDTKPVHELYTPDRIITGLQQDSDMYRIFDASKKYPDYLAQVHDIDTIDVGSNVIPNDYLDIYNNLNNNPDMLNLLNVKYFIKTSQYDYTVELNKDYLPRVFFTETLDINKDTIQSVEIITFSPNKIKVKSETNTSGYVFFSEQYYPGWKAYINNQPTEIIKSHKIFRAVKLSPGKNKITLSYFPQSLKYGLIISLIGILILIYLFSKYRSGQ
tara:strand:+ start:4004 stop:6184 length:2181 start_codon:yes stop_codon:yes gene_type:complete